MLNVVFLLLVITVSFEISTRNIAPTEAIASVMDRFTGQNSEKVEGEVYDNEENADSFANTRLANSDISVADTSYIESNQSETDWQELFNSEMGMIIGAAVSAAAIILLYLQIAKHR